MVRYEGRVELTWTNKSLRLLAHEDGSYQWLPPSDYRIAEVRLLHDAGTVGETGTVGSEQARAADNLLIRGDALNALTSLTELPEFAREYVGRVKLAYLDPPFNTQQSFLHYDDALEHSVWLTMMRDRLLAIKTLLSDEGSVWVHCDDSEQAYLKVMMDEVFGRENFVAPVIWQKIHARNNSAQHFSADHDYIIVFAKNRSLWSRNRVPRTELSNSEFWNPDRDVRGPWRRSDLTASHAYSEGKYEVEAPTVIASCLVKADGGQFRERRLMRYERTIASGGDVTGEASLSASGSRVSWRISYLQPSGSMTKWATTGKRKVKSRACSAAMPYSRHPSRSDCFNG